TARDLDLVAAHRRPEGAGNSIVWLLWHTARVQDDHVVGLSGGKQAWHEGWSERFGLPFGEGDIGYGHSSDDVDAVRVGRLEDLVDYHEAVHQLSLEYAEKVDPVELDRVVDRRWDPPVTAGVRMVSLLGDCLQHLGQAAYVKGLPGSP
ncbi:MAG: DinB family protein, partial [Marmoricola sp.]